MNGNSEIILNNILELISKSADSCCKPWVHSVVVTSKYFESECHIGDLSLRIECRDKYGVRFFDNDLDLEIFKSGNQTNLTLAWSNNTNSAILWLGQHSVWMNSITGLKCSAPEDSLKVESLARKVKALLPANIKFDQL